MTSVARAGWFVVAVAACAAGVSARNGQDRAVPFPGVLDEHPAIQYAARPARDAVAMLDRAIAAGTTALVSRSTDGYLRAVLQTLEIPIESQLLVFSKTGIQRAATSPRNPRALYFNDSVVVGYIPGARWLEIAAHDPEQGVVFYTIDQTAATSGAFVRRTECVRCHVSANTLEVPGMIHRSNFLDRSGDVMPMLGSHTVDHRTPLTQRWGGWFVTGSYTRPPYDGTAHLGNVTLASHPSSGPTTTSNEVFIEWLNSGPQMRGYPSADSDIAALMVFDHQMHAINLLTRLNWESRVAAHDGSIDFSRGPLRELVDEVADYFLFVDEVAPPGRITPRQGFAEAFAATAPRDGQGRSLRDLDLDRRLLRYPCSYMIHTEAFARLPVAARNAVYRRMWTILSGGDVDPKYGHLSPADRRAVIDILRDTAADLPDVFAPSPR